MFVKNGEPIIIDATPPDFDGRILYKIEPSVVTTGQKTLVEIMVWEKIEKTNELIERDDAIWKSIGDQGGRYTFSGDVSDYRPSKE